jgi:predicted metal-binding membrane protein
VSSTDNLPLARILSRPVLIAAAAIALASALAWAWLAARGMAGGDAAAMAGMADMPGMAGPEPFSTGYLLPAFTMWALMMVAMMLPSAAPMILLHARIDRGTAAQRTRNGALFVLCYLAVWTAFSALAALAQAALIGAGLLSSASLALGSRSLTAIVLLAAAVWQLTAAKAACLEQCQSPLQFVMRFWQPGAAGAVRLGVTHGLFCLGCCWSLMLLLFVGGVMNLAWVAFLAAIVFAEKLAPPAWHVSRWLAAGLTVAACAVLIA